MTVRVEYEQKIGVPLAEVWAEVSDFGSILRWVKGGDQGTISLSGSGVGTLRDLVLPPVGAVQHRLDELDDEKHQITYSLTAGQPLGMEAYSVTLRLIDAGGGCTLEWVGTVTPAQGADADQMAGGLKAAYQGMSDGLEGLLAQAR